MSAQPASKPGDGMPATPYGSSPTSTTGMGATSATIVGTVGPQSHWGLGVVSGLLAFGVTLTALLVFAGPRQAAPVAAVAPPPAGSPAPELPPQASPPAPGVVRATTSSVAPPTSTSAGPEAPIHGELAVKAEPAAAEVFVDDRSVGNAPFEGAIEIGTHRVRVQAPSFQTWESEVEVLPGERQSLNVVLSKSQSAKIEVSRRRSKRSTKADDPPEAPVDATPVTKIDRGDSGFKKIGRDDSGFKKIGTGTSDIKKLE